MNIIVRTSTNVIYSFYNETKYLNDDDDQTTTAFYIRIGIKVFIGLIMLIISLTAIVGNLFVIIAMKNDKHLRTVSNIFILSLSISDFLIGLFVMPFSAIYTLFDQEWLFGKVICNIWLSIDYTASTASIFNLFALSLDRYLSIIDPLKYLSKRTKWKATLSILSLWLISSLWILPINFWSFLIKLSDNTVVQSNHLIIIDNQNNTLLDVSNHNMTTTVDTFTDTTDNKCFTDFETNKTFKIITTLLNFYVPLIGMSLIYLKIFYTIKNRSQYSGFEKERNKTNAGKRQQQRGRSRSKQGDSQSSDDTAGKMIDTVLDQNKSESKNDGINNKVNDVKANSNSEKALMPKAIAYQYRQQRNFIVYDECIIDSTSEKILRYLYQDKHRNANTSSEASAKTGDVVPPLAEAEEAEEEEDERIKMSLKMYVSNQYLLLRERFSNASKKRKYNSNKRRNGLVVSYGSSKSANEVVISGNNNNNHEENEANHQHSTNSKSYNYEKKIYFERLNKQIKAARQLGILLAAFLVTWLPYFILFMVVAFCPNCVSDRVYLVAIWLGYFNSAINPILYPLCNSSFKRAFRKMLRLPVYNKYNFIQIMNYTSN